METVENLTERNMKPVTQTDSLRLPWGKLKKLEFGRSQNKKNTLIIYPFPIQIIIKQ